MRRTLSGRSEAALRKCNTVVAGEKDLHRKLVYSKYLHPFIGSFQEQRDRKIYGGGV